MIMMTIEMATRGDGWDCKKYFEFTERKSFCKLDIEVKF